MVDPRLVLPHGSSHWDDPGTYEEEVQVQTSP